MNSKNVVLELPSSSLFDNRIEREWLSTEEAAQYLSITENALRIMVYRGQIQSYKFGRRLRFKLKDCKALYARQVSRPQSNLYHQPISAW